MIIRKWITKKEEGHGYDLIWSPILTFSLLEGKNQHNPSNMLWDLNQTLPQHKSKALMLEPPCLVPPLSPIHAHPSYVLFPVHYSIKINSFHVTQYGLPWTAIRWVTHSVMVPNNSFPCSQNPTAVQFLSQEAVQSSLHLHNLCILQVINWLLSLTFSSSHFHWDLFPNQTVACNFFPVTKNLKCFK